MLTKCTPRFFRSQIADHLFFLEPRSDAKFEFPDSSIITYGPWMVQRLRRHKYQFAHIPDVSWIRQRLVSNLKNYSSCWYILPTISTLHLISQLLQSSKQLQWLSSLPSIDLTYLAWYYLGLFSSVKIVSGMSRITIHCLISIYLCDHLVSLPSHPHTVCAPCYQWSVWEVRLRYEKITCTSRVLLGETSPLYSLAHTVKRKWVCMLLEAGH